MQNSEFRIGVVFGLVWLGTAGVCLGQQTLLNGGGEDSGSGYVISHSLGEFVIPTLSSDDYLITQGQQQPEDDVISVSEITFDLDASVFPNPFRDILTVDATGQGFDLIRLFAVDGSLVFEERTNGDLLQTIRPGSLSRGMYTLVLLKEGREVFVSRVVRS